MKKIKILVIIFTLVLFTGCRKKVTTSVPTIESTTATTTVKPSIFVDAQQKLRNLSSITINEDLLLSFNQEEKLVERNYFYETNISDQQKLMKIHAINSDKTNTTYIRLENGKYMVYPQEKVGNQNVKYELNEDFVLDASNNPVLHYLQFNTDLNTYNVKTNGNMVTYDRIIKLGNLGKNKNMFNDIIYHYINTPINIDDLGHLDIKEEIVINSLDRSIRSISYDISSIFNEINLNISNANNISFKYILELTDYNRETIKFPYSSNDHKLDDAPNTLKNYIYYYSKNTSDKAIKELKPEKLQAGKFDYANDLDVYLFNISTETKVLFNINSDIVFNYTITNKSGDVLFQTPNNKMSTYIPLQPGTYYLKIVNSIGDSGNYDINLKIDDEFSSFIDQTVKYPLKLISISNSKNLIDQLTFIGNVDVIELSDGNYEINYTPTENTQIILVSKFENRIEYEIISADSTKLEINNYNGAKHYVLVYSTGYIGDYKFEIVKK